MELKDIIKRAVRRWAARWKAQSAAAPGTVAVQEATHRKDTVMTSLDCRVAAFAEARYDLRHNVLTGQAEFRPKGRSGLRSVCSRTATSTRCVSPRTKRASPAGTAMSTATSAPTAFPTIILSPVTSTACLLGMARNVWTAWPAAWQTIRYGAVASAAGCWP